MSRTTWVEISRAALLHNVRALRGRVAPARLMAVVKGDAYGHGMAGVARILHDETDWFGVNSLDEALGLHDAGCTRPVLVLGATPAERLDELVRRDFRQVVYSAEGAEALACAAERAGRRAAVHLKIETGTNRLGVRPEAAPGLARLIRARPGLELEGIYTHFANVEDSLDSSFAERQLERFEAAAAGVEAEGPVALRHAAATAAAILHPPTFGALVRAGIGLYGLWPSATTADAARLGGVELDLRPVLTWKTRVVHLNDVALGETVGYGCTYYASQPRRIAVLPLGYYEGLDRGLSSRGPECVGSVLVRGVPCPIVGRVAMNMTMIDVTRVGDVQLGDEAVLIGRQGERELSAETMAAALGTINYEVVARIGASVPRVVVE